MMFEAQLLSALSQIQGKLDQALSEIEGLKVERDRDFATLGEVAGIFGVSETAVRKKINAGELDPMLDIRKSGHKIYIKRSALSKLHFRKNLRNLMVTPA
jgi:hypothetical protein